MLLFVASHFLLVDRRLRLHLHLQGMFKVQITGL